MLRATEHLGTSLRLTATSNELRVERQTLLRSNAHLPPTEPGMARFARRAEASPNAHEALACATTVRVPFEMDCLGAMHRWAKGSGGASGAGGQEQLELANKLARKVIVSAGSGPAWDALVGGFRSDGTEFPGAITYSLPLLALTPTTSSSQILSRAAST
ncbi:hypothetical protein PENSPDRAFT_693467 [Peniophora sp. CONT]|nr:hypothetical protein PENSPDRAFT_693467 [Peniophora sp. CONT]